MHIKWHLVATTIYFLQCCACQLLSDSDENAAISRAFSSFMYSIGFNSDNYKQILFRCPGILIKPQYLLSYAHCLEGKRPWRARPGIVEFNKYVDYVPEDVAIFKSITHNLQYGSSKNDICILHLNGVSPYMPIPILNSMPISNNVKVVCTRKDFTYFDSSLVVDTNEKPVLRITDNADKCGEFVPMVIADTNEGFGLLGFGCLHCAKDELSNLTYYSAWIEENSQNILQESDIRPITPRAILTADILNPLETPTLVPYKEPKYLNELSHMHALGWKTTDSKIEFKCGAVLFKPEFLIASAYCLHEQGADAPFKARAEVVQLNMPTSLKPEDINIHKVIMHSDYKHPSTFNDIALIWLAQNPPDTFVNIRSYPLTPSEPLVIACMDIIDEEFESRYSRHNATLGRSMDLVSPNANITAKTHITIAAKDNAACKNSGSAVLSRPNPCYNLMGIECPACPSGVYTNLYNYVGWIADNSIVPSRTVGYVAGGEPAEPGEFPYMYALGWRATNGSIFYKCGGVLITSLHVLTAAHCFYDSEDLPVAARPLGSNLDDKSVRDIGIVKIIEHDLYSYPSMYNDIAIIELAEVAPSAPASMWRRNDFKKRLVTVIGYGSTKFVGASSNVLLKANLSIITHEECRKVYAPNPVSAFLSNGVIDTQLCADDPKKFRDTCQGDSGGPMIMDIPASNGIRPFVVGITSFGIGCASGTPGVYTRVSKFTDWVSCKLCRPGLICPLDRPVQPFEHDVTSILLVGWTLPNGTIDYKCSGAYYNHKTLVMAAHCLYIFGFEPSAVRSYSKPDIAPLNITKIIIHPDYVYPFSYHDLAIIKLAETDNSFSSITIWLTDEIDVSTIENRGYLDYELTAFSDTDMLSVDLRLLPHKQCLECYGHEANSPDNRTFEELHFCVDDTRWSWNHDAGGPLILHLQDIDEFPSNYLAGMTTYAKGCGPNGPRLYTRMSPYSKWLYRTAFAN